MIVTHVAGPRTGTARESEGAWYGQEIKNWGLAYKGWGSVASRTSQGAEGTWEPFWEQEVTGSRGLPFPCHLCPQSAVTRFSMSSYNSAEQVRKAALHFTDAETEAQEVRP